MSAMSREAVEQQRFRAMVFAPTFTAVHQRLRLYYKVEDSVREDLCSETYCRAWRNWHLYDPTRGDVQHWIMGILRKVFLDHLRAHYRRERLYVLVDPTAVASPVTAQYRNEPVAPTFCAERVTQDQMRRIIDQLDELEHVDRLILVGVLVDDFSYQQLARALNVGKTTVSDRFHRAVGHMRRSLKEATAEAETEHP